MTAHRARLLLAAAAGIALGVLSTRQFLTGRWWNLLLWGLAGAALGLMVREKKEADRAGAVYGLCLTFAFLLSGFAGTPDRLPGFLLLTLLLAMIGALCGAVAYRIGQGIGRMLKKP